MLFVATEESKKSEMTLLDLYSGCGAMSTGLCMVAFILGVKLLHVSFQGHLDHFDILIIRYASLINTISLYLTIKRWTNDINPHTCKSLKHPKTEVVLSVLCCVFQLSLYLYLFPS